MATLADSLISATSRPLLLRARPDLTARKHKYHGRVFWVVKEPVGLNYFRFHEEEYAILQMLDGHTSLDEIKEQFEREFAPQKITFPDLLQFVGMLHRSGLVISEAAGQGPQLVKRRKDKTWREWMGKLANVFSLRFRGVDPERFLNWLYKYTWWFFTWPAVVCVLLFGLSALSLVTVEFDVFSSRLPAFHQFFGPKNWFYLAITMAVVKVLHEFGHGLSCKHFGGECHELGAMLLVFTPALYCNVSDSWMLPNKWHRAAIGAAGMYVEFFLASCATFLWWFSNPGLLNQICLSVMFICSVSTLMFNGNPLMRFDGYYILMDLLEIPNLQQKSREVLKRYFLEYCLGIEQQENPFLPQGNRWLFAVYTVASAIYRWLVVFSIIFFLNKVFEPYGLKIIGRLIALSGLVGLVVQPVWELWKFFYTPGRLHKMKKERAIATAVIAVGVLAFVLFVPLPYSVYCPFSIEGHEAQQVFANVAGHMRACHKKAGDVVREGDVLFELDNPQLRFELATYEGRRDSAQQDLDDANRRAFDDPNAVALVEQAKKTLSAAESLYQAKLDEFNRLTIRAPKSGVVLAVPHKVDKQAKLNEQLPQWTGGIFEVKNHGAFLHPEDLLCQVGDPDNVDAMLVVDQSYMDLVRLKQPVKVLLESQSGTAYWTTVDQIAESELKMLPPTMATIQGGLVEAKADPNGTMRPLSTAYAIRCRLQSDQRNNDSGLLGLQIGLQGRARIYTEWQSIRARVWRYVTKTFHFEL